MNQQVTHLLHAVMFTLFLLCVLYVASNSNLWIFSKLDTIRKMITFGTDHIQDCG